MALKLLQNTSEVDIYVDLCVASHRLAELGLRHASRWAAEQACAMSDATVEQAPELDSALARQPYDLGESASQADAKREIPLVELGKRHFQLREYLQCASVLSHSKSVEGAFLRLYALYLDGEAKREQQKQEESGILGWSIAAKNCHLKVLQEQVPLMLEKCRTVHRYPCNWSAWSELQRCEKNSELNEDALPQHWMTVYCTTVARANSESQFEETITLLHELMKPFPQSPFLMTKIAVTMYHARDFQQAIRMFEIVRRDFPTHLEHMDVFSNILFVEGAAAKLSVLAHSAVQIDKYRPETCCIVGNYYSLKEQHERAVEYFRRALLLDPSYVSAWTLIGHEYVELKNTPAAISAYRHAVDINPQDFRAWYGLGQVYEILTLRSYSLYYFQRAASLRPEDPRMWCAVGLSLYHARQYKEAAHYLERALVLNDTEGEALPHLALAYVAMGADEKAFETYERLVREYDSEEKAGKEYEEALLYLMNEHKRKNRMEECASIAHRLMRCGGAAAARAEAMLRHFEIYRGGAHAAAAPPAPRRTPPRSSSALRTATRATPPSAGATRRGNGPWYTPPRMPQTGTIARRISPHPSPGDGATRRVTRQTPASERSADGDDESDDSMDMYVRPVARGGGRER